MDIDNALEGNKAEWSLDIFDDSGYKRESVFNKKGTYELKDIEKTVKMVEKESEKYLKKQGWM